MKLKSEAFYYFKVFHKYAETHTGRKIQTIEYKPLPKVKAIRSDGGGEYMSNEFKKYLEEHGIHHQATTAYSPQQNGVAERMNRTLGNLVLSMLHHKNIGKEFWAEALDTAVYVRNRVTSRGLPVT